MKLLKCKLCRGECEIIGNDRAVNKKIRCLSCGFTNADEAKKEPEVTVIRKRPLSNEP